MYLRISHYGYFVPLVQVKPVVSKYLTEKQLPYQEDTYLSRLHLFFHKYQELMVFAPPITELVGVQWQREGEKKKKPVRTNDVSRSKAQAFLLPQFEPLTHGIGPESMRRF